MSTYRAVRLGFFAAVLLLVGAGRLAAADSYPFEIRLSNSTFGDKVFTGEIKPEDGSFETFVTSGSTRIHMTGSIVGDKVHVYGELVIPGAASWQRFRPFSADGTFSSAGTATESIAAYPTNGTPARGSITIKRPATAIAAAPAAPAAVPAPPPTGTQTAVVPPPEEPPLTNSQRVAVQHQLSVLGFYKSVADGDFGAGTRKAIRSFQRANKQDATGYLTDTTLTLLAEKASVREQQLAEEQTAAQQAAQNNAGADFTSQHQSMAQLTTRTPTEQTPPAQPTPPATAAATTPETTTSAPAQPPTTTAAATQP